MQQRRNQRKSNLPLLAGGCCRACAAAATELGSVHLDRSEIQCKDYTATAGRQRDNLHIHGEYYMHRDRRSPLPALPYSLCSASKTGDT